MADQCGELRGGCEDLPASFSTHVKVRDDMQLVKFRNAYFAHLDLPSN